MKSFPTFIFICAVFTLASASLEAQCTPDTVNCKDDDGIPGQICPLSLPEAMVDKEYEAVITVIPPSEFETELGTLYLDYLLIDSVTNLPEGIEWTKNAERFYADTAYCVQLSGTPTREGTDTLAIYITPFLKLGSVTSPGPQIVADTSVVLIVNVPSGIREEGLTSFTVATVPNPFSENIQLSFYTPFDEYVELRVYSILGKLVYEESVGASPGKHSFGFTGNELLPGTYFYRVSSSREHSTGKIIKVGR